MRISHIYMILAGALLWVVVYFLSQSVLKESLTTKFRMSLSGIDRQSAQQVVNSLSGYSLHIEQKKRHNVLKAACRRLKINDWLPKNDKDLLKLVKSSVLYFSDKFKFVVCMIPKVGCTNFKRVMLIEHGLTNFTNPENITGYDATDIARDHFRLHTLNNATKIRSRLENYYKFMMVREPMHRILSAFRNKFEANSTRQHFQFLSKKILNFSGHKTRNKGNSTPNFKQFLRYITVDSNLQDNHWRLYHKLCSPCSIEYDFIAKLETVDDDMNYVMNMIGMKKATYPSGYQQPTDDDKVTKYYQSVPGNLLQAIHATYRDDYELFGYSLPDRNQTQP